MVDAHFVGEVPSTGIEGRGILPRRILHLEGIIGALGMAMARSIGRHDTVVRCEDFRA